MVDVATVNAVNTAATAQSAAATPDTFDAGFGALLQAMIGDPSASTAGALTTASNTIALPITSFAATTLIQNTVPDNSNGSAATVAAATIWSPAALPPVKLASTVATSAADAPPDNTAPDDKAADESTTTSDSGTTDATSGLFAWWQLQATPMVAAPQQMPQPVSQQDATTPDVAANPAKSDKASQTDQTAPDRTAANPAKSDKAGQTAPDPTAANPAKSDKASQTDQTAPDPTAANQAAPTQIASNQVVANQTAPVAAGPAVSGETAPDKTAALAAAQTLAAPRGTETGTAELKLKAKSRAPDDVKPSGDKSKPAASDTTATSDKTAEPAAGIKNSPIPPRQDGQTPNDQALNNSSPSATVAQPAPASQSDGHAAKADAGAAQAVSVSPLASDPPKVAADLQVAAGRDGTDTSATLDKLGVTIAAKSLQGLHQFDIRLDPPDLGRVQVKLTVDDNGQAQASLVVDKPQTLDLLQRDSSSLNRALTDAGLNLSNNGLSFSLRDQQQQADGGTNKGRSRTLSVKAALAADSGTIRSTSGSYAPNSVRLDIRV